MMKELHILVLEIPGMEAHVRCFGHVLNLVIKVKFSHSARVAVHIADTHSPRVALHIADNGF